MRYFNIYSPKFFKYLRDRPIIFISKLQGVALKILNMNNSYQQWKFHLRSTGHPTCMLSVSITTAGQKTKIKHLTLGLYVGDWVMGPSCQQLNQWIPSSHNYFLIKVILSMFFNDTILAKLKVTSIHPMI